MSADFTRYFASEAYDYVMDLLQRDGVKITRRNQYSLKRMLDYRYCTSFGLWAKMAWNESNGDQNLFFSLLNERVYRGR